MTRLLVLQQLFNLSDEQMEFQLLERMSFQRFPGLKSSARVPDRNTIWNFRERLVQAKVEQVSAKGCRSTLDEAAWPSTSATSCRSVWIVGTN
ncbi:hypothetical protein D9M71_429700 [compost metagenome]